MSQAVGMIMLFIHLLACHWSGHISTMHIIRVWCLPLGGRE